MRRLAPYKSITVYLAERFGVVPKSTINTRRRAIPHHEKADIARVKRGRQIRRAVR